MNNPYLGAGIAQAGADISQHAAEAPYRKLRLQEAEARAKQADLELKEFESNAPIRQAARDEELARLQAATYQTNAALAKQQAFDSFKLFDADADPRHLNNWVNNAKQNPVGQQLVSDVTRFDRVVRTPEVENMLRAQGITDVEGFFSDPNLSKSFVLATQPDGNQGLMNVNELYMLTGYNEYTTDQRRKELFASSQLISQMRAGGNLAELKKDSEVVAQIADATGLPRSEVFKMLKEQPAASQGRGSSTVERVAEQLRKDNPELSYRDSLSQAIELTTKSTQSKPTNEKAFIDQYMADNPEASYEDALSAYRQVGREQRTTKQRDIEYSEEAKVELDNQFGGNFLEADLNNLTSQQQAEMAKYINRIERAGGLELSAEEKKNARQFRKLISVGKTSGEQLTADQTGPLDSIFRSLKSYISDEVEGKDATVAYESFRAIARNALFGSQVSAADYKAFNNAFASLGKQTGPILVSLRTQLDMMMDDMQAMAELNDPYVVKARFGTSIDELDNVINAIQDRIDIIDAVQKGKPIEGINMPSTEAGSGIKVNVDKTGAPPSGTRPPLTEIFGVQ